MAKSTKKQLVKLVNSYYGNGTHLEKTYHPLNGDKKTWMVYPFGKNPQSIGDTIEESVEFIEECMMMDELQKGCSINW